MPFAAAMSTAARPTPRWNRFATKPALAWPDLSTWPSPSFPRSTPGPPSGSPAASPSDWRRAACWAAWPSRSSATAGRSKTSPALSLWLGRWQRPVTLEPFHTVLERTSEGPSLLGLPDGLVGAGCRRLRGAAAGRSVHVPGGPVPEPDEREQPRPARAGRHGQRHARPGAVPAAVQRRGADARRGRRAAARADRAALDRVAGLPADRPAHGRHARRRTTSSWSWAASRRCSSCRNSGRASTRTTSSCSSRGCTSAASSTSTAATSSAAISWCATCSAWTERAAPWRSTSGCASARRCSSTSATPADGRRGSARPVAAGRARPREAAGRRRCCSAATAAAARLFDLPNHDAAAVRAEAGDDSAGRLLRPGRTRPGRRPELHPRLHGQRRPVRGTDRLAATRRGAPMIDAHLHVVRPNLPGAGPLSPLLDAGPERIAAVLREEMRAAGVTHALAMGSCHTTVGRPARRGRHAGRRPARTGTARHRRRRPGARRRPGPPAPRRGRRRLRPGPGAQGLPRLPASSPRPIPATAPTTNWPSGAGCRSFSTRETRILRGRSCASPTRWGSMTWRSIIRRRASCWRISAIRG